MAFEYFVEVPLLWASFFIFIVGLLVRVVAFIKATLEPKEQKVGHRPDALKALLGSFVPFHRSALDKPFYTASRYLFHICLFVVPIWLAGHVMTWSDSRFGWQWMTLPDQWADGMTLTVLCFIGYFFLRRILSTEVRKHSSVSDFILLFITAAPFLSGYFLMHETPDALDFLYNHMWTIHVLSGEMLLVSAACLVCHSCLKTEKCTGCATCASHCPTDALVYNDKGNMRTFFRFTARCICCGVCVKVCPEKASEIRHEMSFQKLFKFFPKEEIQSVELAVCKGCRALFAPELLLNRMEKSLLDDYRHYCSSCKKSNLAANFYKLAPWSTNLQDEMLEKMDRPPIQVNR